MPTWLEFPKYESILCPFRKRVNATGVPNLALLPGLPGPEFKLPDRHAFTVLALKTGI
jgi:hypothetical protein